ncbi:MAG: hypothetical protein LAT82_02945 [Nanoarchaeota archaeon]|nr:hypothetical protein [Nanoarchaeota archaeon]
MANRRHLKRHSMPTAWPTFRKTETFVTRPKPGSMKRKYVVPVSVFLRDVLKVVYTTKEAKYVVHKEYVLINGKIAQDIKSPIGLLDVVEITKLGKKYSFVFDTKGRIKVIEVQDSNVYTKVTGKTLIKGGQVQINTLNGFNVLVDSKEAKKIDTDSTIIVDTKTKKISSTLPLAQKAQVYVMDGKYKGQFGVAKSFTHYNGVAPDLVELEIANETHLTAKEYCFVVDSKRRVD